MAELGWKSVGVLELTALPSIARTVWLPEVEQADVLLVNGGDTIYLDRWMRESGLAELLPSLDLVYVGLSAGSLVMSPAVADIFASWTRPSGAKGWASSTSRSSRTSTTPICRRTPRPTRSGGRPA